MLSRCTLVTAFALFAVACFPPFQAHAISAKHRAALERSGCTQVTESAGCDISQSAEWNRRHQPDNREQDAAARAELVRFIRERVQSQPVGAASQALTGYGFIQTDPGIWLKSDAHRTQVLNLIIQHDVVTSVIIK